MKNNPYSEMTLEENVLAYQTHYMGTDVASVTEEHLALEALKSRMEASKVERIQQAVRELHKVLMSCLGEPKSDCPYIC